MPVRKSNKMMDKTILVVEDELEVAELLKVFLCDELNCRVLVAGSADEALRLLREISVHLILLDIVLPTTDGLQLYDRLQSTEATRGIPVLLMTASAHHCGQHAELEARGLTNYVLKPFDLDDFLERVRDLLVGEVGPAPLDSQEAVQ